MRLGILHLSLPHQIHASLSGVENRVKNLSWILLKHRATTWDEAECAKYMARCGKPVVVPPAELEQYLQSVPKVTDVAVIPYVISFSVHRGEGGESSFSVACPSLGLITYCKPIGCYGDILLHSSSSTLNTRSSLCRPFFLQDKKQLGDLNFIYCIHHLIPIPSSSEFCGQTD
ncbi:hypothetical protein Tco_0613988 [Tanacetum coccineum]